MPRIARHPLATLAALTVAGATLGLAPAAAQADAPSKVNVLLELRHGGGLHDFVRAVSNPDSPRYRRYASVEQLAQRFGASRQAQRRTAHLLRDHGLTAEVGATGTYVLATGTRAEAASLFGTAATTRAATKGEGGRATVPAQLAPTVADAAFIAGDTLAQERQSTPLTPEQIRQSSLRPRTGTPAGCPDGLATGLEPGYLGFTPNQWLTAYGHAALHDQGLRGQGMRIALVEIDGYNPDDIAQFGACFDIDIPRIVPHKVGIKKLLAPGDETTLDLSVLSAGAPGLERIDVYEGGASNAAILKTTAAALGTPKNRPDVISISVGGCEIGSYGQIAQMRAMNTVYALAAGAGISVVAAAGDQGSTDCEVGDYALPFPSVDFPGSSPYVTSVGGTNIELDAANRITSEFVWNDSPVNFGGSGGGYSILHDRPWYQTKAGTSTDDVMRTVPDITALADSAPGYIIRCTSVPCQQIPSTVPGWIAVGGTSAAAPLTAALTALADQAARKRGQANLGTLNPLIYAIGSGKQYGTVIRDVTVGGNDLGAMIPVSPYGGGQAMGCCSATKGYDTASGWGSLNGVPFVKAAVRAGR